MAFSDGRVGFSDWVRWLVYGVIAWVNSTGTLATPPQFAELDTLKRLLIIFISLNTIFLGEHSTY